MFSFPPSTAQVQPQPDLKPEPSSTFKKWQRLQKAFFLVTCGSGSLAATNLIRLNQAYFWLYAILIVVAIIALLFFPEKRFGSLAIGAGIALALWEVVAAFRLQVQHFAAIGILVVLVLLALAALGGKK